jgi:hypothetical protein
MIIPISPVYKARDKPSIPIPEMISLSVRQTSSASVKELRQCRLRAFMPVVRI